MRLNLKQMKKHKFELTMPEQGSPEREIGDSSYICLKCDVCYCTICLKEHEYPEGFNINLMKNYLKNTEYIHENFKECKYSDEEFIIKNIIE